MYPAKWFSKRTYCSVHALVDVVVMLTEYSSTHFKTISAKARNNTAYRRVSRWQGSFSVHVGHKTIRVGRQLRSLRYKRDHRVRCAPLLIDADRRKHTVVPAGARQKNDIIGILAVTCSVCRSDNSSSKPALHTRQPSQRCAAVPGLPRSCLPENMAKSGPNRRSLQPRTSTRNCSQKRQNPRCHGS